MERGEATTVVYDAPSPNRQDAETYQVRLRILPQVLERRDQGIARRERSPQRQPVNARVLEFTRGEDWPSLLNRYPGKMD